MKHVICSRRLREIVAAHYPGLRRHPAHWRMLAHLLFATDFCEDTGQVLISQRTIANIEGRRVGENYTARHYLSQFRADVLPEFEWSRYNREQQRARVVTNTGIADTIWQAKQADADGVWDETGRVYFITGQVLNERNRRRYREGDRTRALELLATAHSREAQAALQYLNGQHSGRYTTLLQRLSVAREAARALLNAEVRERNLSLLRAIEGQAQPFYKPVRRSTRIYALNDSILLLKREVREAFMQDCYKYDLKSAQLAICSVEWQVTEVVEFLQTGASIWQSMYEHYGIVPNEEIKSIFKTALYHLIFGGNRQNILYGKPYCIQGQRRHKPGLITQLQNYGLDGYHFFDHPLINAMYQGARSQLRNIATAGGGRTCYGQWLSTANYTPRSILAQQAQAIEFQLIWPIFRHAINTDAFTIMLHLHDGGYLHIQDRRRVQTCLAQIKRAVDSQCLQLGYPTTLDVPALNIPALETSASGIPCAR